MFLPDINISMCFISFFFNIEGVLLVMRGCACVLRGCSRTLKTPNSLPLRQAHLSPKVEYFDIDMTCGVISVLHVKFVF